MTPPRPHTVPRRHRAVDVVRGLISLVVLFALLGALPALLWVLTGVLLPDGVSPDEVASLLTSHELGTPFWAVILAIGWISWATFALCTLLEIPAQLRGRPTLSLPAMGFQQRMAGALVSGVLVLLPTGTAMAAPASATPAVTHAPAAATAPLNASAVSAPMAPATDQSAGTYTVQARDSLSKIALEQLGDASRWREIAAANAGVAMVDGTSFSTRSVLQPGWQLTMPQGWEPADREHRVTPGETLSSIAEAKLGDANRYPQIVELNEGQRQPDGRALTDPDKIYPGWELQLPRAVASEPDTGGPAAPDVPSTGQQDEDSAQEAPGERADQDSAPSTSPDPGSSEGRGSTPKDDADTVPNDTATPETAAPPSRPETFAAQPPAEGTGNDSSVTSAAIAVTSLFAAAVLAVLGGRRALQQRRRRPKRRIPLPQQATAPADMEKQFRVASDVDGLDLVDRALRTLSANCATTDQPLPQLAAIRVMPRGLELHLSAPTPQVGPFVEMEEHPDRWWCPARGVQLLAPDQSRDIPPPYPALVSLGETEEREPVLVNLESVGVLRLSGTGVDVRAVMLGMAVELASSGLSDDATVILAGLGDELAGVLPGRVEYQSELAHALPALRAHDALQRGALTTGSLDGLNQARLAEDGGDVWAPKVLITSAAPGGEEAEVLTDLLSSRPRTATAVVTMAESELDVPGAWTLPAAPGAAVQLPGLDLTVIVQRLDVAAYAPLIQLLATAARTDDVAAPAWTHGPDGTAAQNGPTRITPQGDSALAQDVPDVAAVEDGSPEFSDVPGPDEPQAAPAVHVAASPLSSSLITAVPKFSLAPSPPGAEGGLSDDSGAGQQYGDGGAEEVGAEEEPLPEDLFDETLRGVLNERDAPEVAGEYEQREGPVGEAAGFDELAAEQTETESSAQSPATRGDSSRPQYAPERVERPATRVSAVTSGVLAALNMTPDPPSAPQIRVLGPVDVVSTLGKVESNRRNGLTEIAAWLALHPGKSRHELDEAIWPGQRVRADTRNTNISKLRAWLGRDPLLPAEDPHGAYLPPISEGVYAFNDEVTTDWQQFQALYKEGMHSSGPAADTALANALSLVRGRPFSSIDQSKYSWAEYDIQEMISTITDVAHELATRRRAVRDYRAALAAASRGLVCDQSELLYRDLFTIYSETGDRQGLERTAHQLTRIAIESGCDSAPETVALINALMDANRIASA